MDIHQALTALGTTQEQIADTLRDLGIKGKTYDPCGCPIARYLRTQGIEARTGRVCVVVVDAEGEHRLDTPLPICYFMAAFDTLEYPELMA